MALIETRYIITLSRPEADALKKCLGGFNDIEFSKAGVSPDHRILLHEIYDLLPDLDDGQDD